MNRMLAPVLLCGLFSATTLLAQPAARPVSAFTPAVGVEHGTWRAEPQAGNLRLGLQPGSTPPAMAGVPPVLARHQAGGAGDDYERWAGRLALIQGAYYVATGLWPIIHMRSFEQVTGPKTDDWLVKTVGGLITVVGGALLVAGLRDAPSRDLAAVAVGSAAALTAVDVIYVARGRISRVYLLDAAAETVLIGGWAVTLSL